MTDKANMAIGGYVNTPAYLEMRLRMALTGTASPTEEQWVAALRKLLSELKEKKS